MAILHQPQGADCSGRESLHRRGIFGGTFNPPHWGHLQVAEAALKQVALFKVLWVPTYNPPYRNPETLASFQHRLAMVDRAIAPIPAFEASTVEQDLAHRQTSPSFAIDTLAHLQQQYPQSDWYWILGLDSFCTLPRWRNYQQLIPQCTWLVAPRREDFTIHKEDGVDRFQRAGAIAHQLQGQGLTLRWQWLSMPSLDISSSQIRRYCGDRHSIAGLVPTTVEDYIHRYKLYLPNS